MSDPFDGDCFLAEYAGEGLSRSWLGHAERWEVFALPEKRPVLELVEETGWHGHPRVQRWRAGGEGVLEIVPGGVLFEEPFFVRSPGGSPMGVLRSDSRWFGPRWTSAFGPGGRELVRLHAGAFEAGPYTTPAGEPLGALETSPHKRRRLLRGGAGKHKHELPDQYRVTLSAEPAWEGPRGALVLWLLALALRPRRLR